MVGRRPLTGGRESRGDRFSPKPRSGFRYRDDEEAATPVSPVHASGNGRPKKAQAAVAEARRQELKGKVLDGMKHFSLEWYRKPDAELKKIKNKKLRNFYASQNDRLDDWIEVDAVVYALADDVMDSMNPDADRDGVAERRGPLQESGGELCDFLPAEYRERRAMAEKQAKRAINVNVVANVIMLVGKLISLRFSPSLSLVASTADSALDLFCTLIIYGTNRLVAWRLDSLRMKFPVGRRRMEPLGILVFSVVMVVSFLQILQESVQKLLPGGDRGVAPLPPVAIAAMAGNAIIKGIIGLVCLPIRTTQVQALVQDCKTDVYFNTASLLFPLLGAALDVVCNPPYRLGIAWAMSSCADPRFEWWLDPVGAAVLALYVIYDWAETCILNVSRLTGMSVDDTLLKKMYFLAYRFCPVVDGFKNLMAYHSGEHVWVELDVLFDEATSLTEAHDVAETLQYCYEGLEEVDRAFVSVDYSSLGPLGHAVGSETMLQ